MAGGECRCCKMAGWLITPLWLLEMVNDFVNVIFILFELVKDFLHEISPCAMLGGDSSHFINEVFVSDGTFN